MIFAPRNSQWKLWYQRFNLERLCIGRRGEALQVKTAHDTFTRVMTELKLSHPAWNDSSLSSPVST